jgi:hypothetical protein
MQYGENTMEEVKGQAELYLYWVVDAKTVP